MAENGGEVRFAPRIDQSVLVTKLGRRSGGRLVEDAADIVLRVAGSLADVERRFGAGDAEVERRRQEFLGLMTGNRFWPSGRILNNCGTRQSQLASCFVLPVEDDLGAIFDVVKLAAQCHRTGGGTGFDLSRVRERGAPISTAEAGGASGPSSWLHVVDAATSVVAQGGKMRGACLASLSVEHPDIIEFIDAKREVGRLHNLNISVLISDAYMAALAAGGRIDLVSPVDGRVVRSVPATDIWQRIGRNAWRTGDPGVLFADRINDANPLAAHLGPITTTNPCGEQTLYPYEASNLGSVNLASFLNAATGEIDWAGLEATVTSAVRLLDNAIDASRYPDERVSAMAQDNRRLGLGVMGYADLLVGLGVGYDSPAAMELIDRIGALIKQAAWAASRQLAKERGPFPNWTHTAMPEPSRNCAITTIAPTGTISMVAGCSSGIEPRFAAIWVKDVLLDSGVHYVDEDLLSEVQQARQLTRREAMEVLARVPVAELGLPGIRAGRYRYAHDVSGEWHVRTVAQWQRYIDNAISKTVNLPGDCTPDQVGEMFALAWRLGCKGLSVYRQGSRERDLLEHVAEPPRQSRQLIAAGAQ